MNLAKLEFQPELLNQYKKVELNEEELKVLEEWMQLYENKYPCVGLVEVSEGDQAEILEEENENDWQELDIQTEQDD